VGFTASQDLLQLGNFVQHLLEPEFIGLVNDDEKHLIVLAIRLRLLQFE